MWFLAEKSPCVGSSGGVAWRLCFFGFGLELGLCILIYGVPNQF